MREQREKELRRLSRSELLELLLTQTQENERLTQELEETRELLAQRQLKVQQAGDLAHAVLAVNGVMEAAQRSAEQYLENIRAMEEQAKETCRRMIAEAEEEAAKIRAEAEINRNEEAPEESSEQQPEEKRAAQEKRGE